MKNIFLVLLALSLVGCLASSKYKGSQNQRMTQQEPSPDRDSEIAKLQELLKEKEGELKIKDAKIEELRKKLESFGVFVQ